MSNPTASTATSRKVQSRTASSDHPDARAAVREIRDALQIDECKAVIAFVSSHYDLVEAGDELRQAFPCPVLACTTAGEIGPHGLGRSTIVAVALAGAIDAELHAIDLADEQRSLEAVIERITTRAHREPLRHSCCLVLHDGLAGREERLNAALQDALTGTRLLGGSAGDDLDFRACHVFVHGAFRRGNAVLLHLLGDTPLMPIKIQHFAAGEDLMVVTSADPATRRIREIDGLPAVEVYSERTGVPVAELGPTAFSRFPFVVEIDGDTYIRSIRAIEDDGSISLLCAIEEGVLFSLGRALDPIAAAKSAFDWVVTTTGRPAVVIGFDCILRGLEAQASESGPELYRLYREHGVIGFHTYGETYGRLHVNQTFTGLAIGGG